MLWSLILCYLSAVPWPLPIPYQNPNIPRVKTRTEQAGQEQAGCFINPPKLAWDVNLGPFLQDSKMSPFLMAWPVPPSGPRARLLNLLPEPLHLGLTEGVICSFQHIRRKPSMWMYFASKGEAGSLQPFYIFFGNYAKNKR